MVLGTSPSKLKRTADDETVCGYLQRVSDVKRSGNGQLKYFNAELVDCDEGALPARIVVFDPAQHQQFVSHATVKTPVTIEHCAVKRSLDGSRWELTCKSKRTKICPHPELGQTMPAPITLAKPRQSESGVDVSSLSVISEQGAFEEKDRVNVTARVVAVKDPVTVMSTTQGRPRPFVKQDITLADGTGSINLVLWKDMVGQLTFDQVYAFTNLEIKQYRGEIYLTFLSGTSKHSISTSADDIQAVGDTNEFMMSEPEPSDITRGTPVFVDVQPETLTCLNCKRRVEDDGTPGRFLRCGHCAAKLKRAACVDSDFACIVGIMDNHAQKRVMLKDGVIRDLLVRLEKSNSSVSKADLEDLILGLDQIELKVDAGVALHIISFIFK